MDLQFTRQTSGYQQLEMAMELEMPEEDRSLLNVQELKKWEDRRLQKMQELKKWEEDKLVELIQRLALTELTSYRFSAARSTLCTAMATTNRSEGGRHCSKANYRTCQRSFRGNTRTVLAKCLSPVRPRPNETSSLKTDTKEIVSAEQGTRDRVRTAVTQFVGPDMEFREMDFQPVQERGLKWELAHKPEPSGVEMALRRGAYAA